MEDRKLRKRARKTGSMSLGDRRRRKMTHRLPFRPWQQHLHLHRNPLFLIFPIVPFHPVPLTTLTLVWASDRGSPHPLRLEAAPSILTIPLHPRLLLAHKHDRTQRPETPLFPSQASQSWVPKYPSLSSRLHPLFPTVTAILTVAWRERDHHTIPLRLFIPPLPLTTKKRVLTLHTSIHTCRSRRIRIHRQRQRQRQRQRHPQRCNPRRRVPPPFLPLSHPPPPPPPHWRYHRIQFPSPPMPMILLPTQRKMEGRTLKWSKETNKIRRGKVFY